MAAAVERIVVQATPQEKKAIAAKAKRLGLPISELMRRGATAYRAAGADEAADARCSIRLPWSRAWQLGDVSPAPDLTLQTLTEFDPRQCRYRHGRWEQ